jgi:hypothetical protein
VDPVASQVGGYVVFEQIWSQVRHGLAVLGWVIFAGLVAAAGCWCCGYVVHSDVWRSLPPARRRRSADAPAVLPDDDVAQEAARGIREIERYLSTV